MDIVLEVSWKHERDILFYMNSLRINSVMDGPLVYKEDRDSYLLFIVVLIDPLVRGLLNSIKSTTISRKYLKQYLRILIRNLNTIVQCY